MDLEQANNLAQTIQSVITSIAIIASAVWAYYRFVRFRTLKPRLEFHFDFKSMPTKSGGFIAIVSLKAANKGNVKIDLRKNGESRCHLKYGVITAEKQPNTMRKVNKDRKSLERQIFVFAPHQWIEPDETIDDTVVLHLPSDNDVVLQMELLVFGKQKWSSSAAFLLSKEETSSSLTSEDEQEEYKESEALAERMKTILSTVLDEHGEFAELKQINDLIDKVYDAIDANTHKIETSKSIVETVEKTANKFSSLSEANIENLISVLRKALRDLE